MEEKGEIDFRAIIVVYTGSFLASDINDHVEEDGRKQK